MIQHRDTGDETDRAMTDEREKKERVFEMFGVMDDYREDRLVRCFEFRSEADRWVGSGCRYSVVPCRVIVEDEP